MYPIKKIFKLTIVLLLLQMELGVAQINDLKSELRAFKVELKDGKELLTSADKVAPGDIIEYQLSYTNKTGDTIKSLKPVLPIPFGTELIENTAFPVINDASISDENSFQTYPIMKEITLPNGSKTKIKSPSSAYRYVRWNTAILENDAKTDYKIRVKVVEVKK